MARSDHVLSEAPPEKSPETLTPADLTGCLALSDEAGWNQTAEDWRLFLRAGKVHGWRDAEGALIATGASLPYDGYGFVSMVLVTARARRQGHATRLLRHAVTDLQLQGLLPVLDATPEGALVYARDGFAPVFGFARLGRSGAAPPPGPETPSEILGETAPGAVEAAIALDAATVGASRAALLQDFASRPGTRLITSDGGFAFARRGRRAVQIGPITARSEAEAGTLLDELLAGLSGAVFIDVPDRCRTLLGGLAACGFAPLRRFTRMSLGRPALFGAPERQFALAGPEFG